MPQPHANQIKAQGIIVEVISPGAYRVELANGHPCIAHMGREQKKEANQLACGDHVQLEFHPYDLSKGRIILAEGI